MAKVSVIVPVYNSEKYLDQCIQSVLKQSFTDFQLILVDDGSTDRSGEICNEYAKNDHRICVIHKENGGGAGEARNAGISSALAPFICFLDSDDWYDEKMLEIMVEAQEKEDYDIVICGYQNIINETDEKYNYVTVFSEESLMTHAQTLDYFVQHYPEGMVGYPWNKLYRKDIIETNKLNFPKMRRLEDGIFNVEYFNFVQKCCVLDKALCNYRMSQQVERKKLPLDFYDLMEVFVEQYFKQIKKWGYDRSKAERAMIVYFLNDFVCCLENICYNKDQLKIGEKRGMLKELQKKKLVRYMLKKERLVPRYSRIVIGLFEKRQYSLLMGAVNLKMLLKTRLSKVFQTVKRAVN